MKIQLLTLNYTSGTTSNPKGVMLTHRGNYMNAANFMYHLGVKKDDVYLHTLPMFHANGWSGVWAITAAGGTHVCLRSLHAWLRLYFNFLCFWIVHKQKRYQKQQRVNFKNIVCEKCIGKGLRRLIKVLSKVLFTDIVVFYILLIGAEGARLLLEYGAGETPQALMRQGGSPARPRVC